MGRDPYEDLGDAPSNPTRCRCGSPVAQWERLIHARPLRDGCAEWLAANDWVTRRKEQ